MLKYQSVFFYKNFPISTITHFYKGAIALYLHYISCSFNCAKLIIGQKKKASYEGEII